MSKRPFSVNNISMTVEDFMTDATIDSIVHDIIENDDSSKISVLMEHVVMVANSHIWDFIISQLQERGTNEDTGGWGLWKVLKKIE
jgi:hypothetical protein